MPRCLFLSLAAWILSCVCSPEARAATFGNFTYSVSGSAITITDFPTTVAGTIVIPETIEGKPVKVIGIDAFRNCELLTGVTLPSTLTTISNTAFGYCLGLTSMVIPDGVTSIGTQAFLSCSKITSMEIPASVATFGSIPFSACTGLEYVTVASSNPNYSSVDGVVYNKSQTALVQCPAGKIGPLVIQPTVTSIPDYAVSRASKLTHITVPPGLVTAGQNVFQYCTSLTGVIIPEGVTTLGSGAFFFCSSLPSLSLPSTLVTFSGELLVGCSSLSTLAFPAGHPAYEVIDGVAFSKDTKVLLWYPIPRPGPYVVPDGVTAIGIFAFEHCVNLSSIGFPPSVKQIREYAFQDCDGLRNVTIGAGVISIGTGSFSDCGDLGSVTLPATLETMGLSFTRCPKLTRAVFLGAAPSGAGFFDNADSTFKVYFFDGATGFITPRWRSYNSVNMGAPSPVKNWLVGNRLPYDTSLGTDHDNDGVKLLISYALALDPNGNPSAKLPKAVLEEGNLKLPFYSGAPGISYSVESSTDLDHWTSEGVVLSPADVDQIRTATIQAGDPARFLRLVVAE